MVISLYRFVNERERERKSRTIANACDPVSMEKTHAEATLIKLRSSRFSSRLDTEVSNIVRVHDSVAALSNDELAVSRIFAT